MDLMIIIGYALALIVGVSLGLIGSGGSILAVPILVYLLGLGPEQEAPAYSLFVVGVVSLIGGIQKYKTGNADIKTFIVFGIPAIITVYLTRGYLVPIIPDPVFGMSKRLFIMGLFAVLMLLASLSMILNSKKKTKEEEEKAIKFNYPLILIEGVVVGILTGLVGAGGGFLIIPALVKFSNLTMKKAVGTSLLIIAAKSLFGFLGDVQRIDINWTLLLSFTALAIGGIFIGNLLSKKIEGEKLKRGFGWFVLIMGAYILTKELFI